jgi:LPS O-antigen subunit length determinant protein (WzzB/FepE family)
VDSLSELVTTAINSFAKEGLLGILLIILGARYLVVEKRLADYQEKLVKAWKENGEQAKNTSEVLANWTQANEARTRALEATIRVSELAAQAQQELSRNIQRLAEASEESTRSIQGVREALLKRVPGLNI